ncbi:hypothetical protein CALVIDRAFT_167200 [Calocera viscosa TUFC12733]|uniref:Uncharacterized protein n=1 Tax=Calocera viscosa (strain TUFC12733) TaxID=1330018 RepID=A0A167L4Z6_CALVF|nr:hypothetical protein CALVIDRAFT_167200 [Calocera viscosa TUFC12733]
MQSPALTVWRHRAQHRHRREGCAGRERVGGARWAYSVLMPFKDGGVVRRLERWCAVPEPTGRQSDSRRARCRITRVPILPKVKSQSSGQYKYSSKERRERSLHGLGRPSPYRGSLRGGDQGFVTSKPRLHALFRRMVPRPPPLSGRFPADAQPEDVLCCSTLLCSSSPIMDSRSTPLSVQTTSRYQPGQSITAQIQASSTR